MKSLLCSYASSFAAKTKIIVGKPFRHRVTRLKDYLDSRVVYYKFQIPPVSSLFWLDYFNTSAVF